MKRSRMTTDTQNAKKTTWDVVPTSIQLVRARDHRWLAIDNSYVSRMVNLTTLAPDIVAAILDDTLPNYITLFDLAVAPPALWGEQQ